MSVTTPDTAPLGAFAEDDKAQEIYLAAKRRLLWRRRLLPIVALLSLLVLWEISVAVFDIKPYIAPAPSAIFDVLVNRFGMLMSNLLPTAIEAIAGFLIGNLAAIMIATAFAYN
jgi:NitT/TauT family transport system permease protein